MNRLTRLLATVLATTATWSTPTLVLGAEWPSNTIRLVAAYGPGSATDIVARLLAVNLQDQLHTSVIVDNKAGALGVIGTDFVTRAKPDGYTLLVTTGTMMSLGSQLYKSVKFDPIKDFTAISLICTLPMLLTVDPKLPVRNMKELEAYAKGGHPLTYGYGNGAGQIGGALLAKAWGIPMTGVSYKGSPQAMTDVMTGNVSLTWTDVGASKPFLQAGSLRPLALADGHRSKLLPDLLTVEEASGLKDFELVAWIGVNGPPSMPAPIVAKLNAALNATLRKPEVQKTLADLGFDPAGLTPAQYEAFEKTQYKLWGDHIRRAGIEAQ